MRNKCFNPSLFGTIFCCLSLFTSQLIANDLGRDFEHVVLSGSEFNDFNHAVINELFLFAYNGSNKTWQQIPFQIDEKHDSENYVYPGQQDGGFGFDENDELVFMLKDAGDENNVSWISDQAAQTHRRYEIKVTNPLNEQSAYAYLYLSNTLEVDPNLNDYIDHFESTTNEKGEDKVVSNFYEIRHEKSSLPGYLSIPRSAGGNGVDLVEELKFRAKAKVKIGPFPITIDISEKQLDLDDSRNDFIQVIDGRIRIVRKVDAALEVPIIDPIDFVMPAGFFYPYSSIIDIRVPTISDATISDGRMSLNLAETATGMKFTSAKNSPTTVPIDGNNDDAQLDKTLDGVLPDGNWLFFGEGDDAQGTLVTLFPLQTNVGESQSLFYEDKGSGNAYANAGIFIGGNIETEPSFTLTYKGYYLSSSFNRSIGEQIASWEKNPVQTSTNMQDLATVPVELVAFQATVEDNDVFLGWQTATESNNFGFEVELKQADEKWRKVGFVEGNGTTVQPKSYHFTLEDLQPGKHDFRLKQIDTDGAFEYSHVVSAFIGVPVDFALQQNFPNPFNPTTTIAFQVPEIADGGTAKTTLKIYNILGKEIITLVDDLKLPGSYSVAWNAKDKNGLLVPSGIYLYRLQSGSFAVMKKMILVK